MGYFTYAAARRSERNARAARREAQLLRWEYEEDTGRLADESGTAPYLLAALVVGIVTVVGLLVWAVVRSIIWLVARALNLLRQRGHRQVARSTSSGSDS